jgi:hypothetical protein
MSTTNMSRRGLLAGVPAMAVAVAPAAATAAPESIDAILEGRDRKVKQHILDVVFGWLDAHDDAKTGAKDPVFAAIEAHLQALQAVEKAFARDHDNPVAMEEATEAEQESLLDFLYTEPTTIAGALAALEFASSPAHPGADHTTVHDKPVLAAVFESKDSDLNDACAAWPAMIGRNVRRLIETHAMLGTVAFGPTVIKG